MRVSLVMGSINRTEEVRRFLAKLDSQTYRDFELIVVDQNLDERLQEILKPYKTHFSILHLCSEPGLSRARNVGLKHITGEIVAFPDDDCCFPPYLLETVINFFKQNPTWDGLAGSPTGEGYWDQKAGSIDCFNVWKRSISFTIFLQRSVIEVVGYFDELLGVGAGTAWGSGEETDFLLRAIFQKKRLYYEPSIKVDHPGPISISQDCQQSFDKSYYYAAGKGRVLRKANAPFWFFTYQCSKPLARFILGAILRRPEQQKLGWKVFQGIRQGWKSLI